MQLSKLAFERKVTNWAKAHGQKSEFINRTIANIVLAQLIMQIDSSSKFRNFVKGGTGILLRRGLASGRATGDLDMTMNLERQEITEFVKGLNKTTWGSFCVAGVRELPDKTKSNIPEDFRIKEFRVQLAFGESAWRTAILEVSREEFATPDLSSEEYVDDEIFELFRYLDLQAPSVIRLIPIELQIAHKLHAMSAPNSVRGHDIYDVHLLSLEANLDMPLLARQVGRTFSYRSQHSWTKSISPSAEFKQTFNDEVMDIPNAPTFEEALATVLNLMAQIDPYLTERK